MSKERFISPAPPTSPRLTELLAILTEEGCEVGQRSMKAIRFGDSEIQPGKSLNNLERVEEEVGDFLGTVFFMIEEGYFSEDRLLSYAEEKKTVKLPNFLQTSPDRVKEGQ